MKAHIRKRLDALDALASRAALRPLVLIDVMKLPEPDRDAYWAGDDVILTHYGARDGAESSPGRVETLVISLHPQPRQEWLTTRDMDDEDLEDHEQRQAHEEARRVREAREAAEAAKLAAIRAAQDQLSPAPANAYSPDWD